MILFEFIETLKYSTTKKINSPMRIISILCINIQIKVILLIRRKNKMYSQMDKVVFESRRELEIIEKVLQDADMKKYNDTEQEVIHELVDILDVIYMSW